MSTPTPTPGALSAARGDKPWFITEHTPTTIKTPHGHISVSWGCNFDDGATDRLAHDACRLICEAVNTYDTARPDVDALVKALDWAIAWAKVGIEQLEGDGINCEKARVFLDEHSAALACHAKGGATG